MNKSSAASSLPRVSVVIPAYNAEAAIARAILSALGQTASPLEVIVVDDGSSDTTASVVESIVEDSRLRLLRQPVNHGPSAARNRGLDAARGEWIAYLDADDSWHPEKLERCLALIKDHKDAQLIYHRYITGTFPERLPELSPRKQSWRSMLLRNPVATPTAMHPVAADLRWNEEMRHMEDHDFFLRLAERGPVVFLPLPLVQLGRPVLSPGGLSADVAAMRAGERILLRAAARRKLSVKLLLPVLLFVSKLKELIRPLRRLR